METAPVTRIFLLGPPASGKTTGGRRLAALLGWSFADTDELVAAQAGISIPAIFATDGEDRFRDLEAAALADAAERERVVVATGGGAVTRATNRALLRASGWRVALGVAPEVALARLEADRDGPARPLLAGDDPLRRLHALADERARLYA